MDISKFDAYRENKIEYDPKAPRTDDVVIPDGELTDEEIAGFWGNEGDISVK